MINFINSWIKGIIIAVIISTIIEMILPEGSIKKYVRTVIGVFIVFAIISPVITKITGKEINLKLYELPETKTYETAKIDTNAYIESTYLNTIKQDIEENIEKQGYKINSILVDIDKSEENYGKINKIDLKITKQENNLSRIEQVEIYIGREVPKAEADIDNNEKIRMKSYLSSNYRVQIEQIHINE